MTNTISFPGLNLGPFSISESFSIFGLNIHLYGVIIGIGIVFAYIFSDKPRIFPDSVEEIPEQKCIAAISRSVLLKAHSGSGKISEFGVWKYNLRFIR